MDARCHPDHLRRNDSPGAGDEDGRPGAYILTFTTDNGLGFYPFNGSLNAGDVYITQRQCKGIRFVFGDGIATELTEFPEMS